MRKSDAAVIVAVCVAFLVALGLAVEYCLPYEPGMPTVTCEIPELRDPSSGEPMIPDFGYLVWLSRRIQRDLKEGTETETVRYYSDELTRLIIANEDLLKGKNIVITARNADERQIAYMREIAINLNRGFVKAFAEKGGVKP